jgi:hypothetical protein
MIDQSQCALACTKALHNTHAVCALRPNSLSECVTRSRPSGSLRITQRGNKPSGNMRLQAAHASVNFSAVASLDRARSTHALCAPCAKAVPDFQNFLSSLWTSRAMRLRFQQQRVSTDAACEHELQLSARQLTPMTHLGRCLKLARRGAGQRTLPRRREQRCRKRARRGAGSLTRHDAGNSGIETRAAWRGIPDPAMMQGTAVPKLTRRGAGSLTPPRRREQRYRNSRGVARDP